MRNLKSLYFVLCASTAIAVSHPVLAQDAADFAAKLSSAYGTAGYNLQFGPAQEDGNDITFDGLTISPVGSEQEPIKIVELDGRAVETQTVSVPPGAPASVTFPPFTLARSFTRGTVRIGDDALKQDNAFHFVVSPAQRLPVLIVEPSRAPREASFYLQKALSIGTAPAFRWTYVRANRSPAQISIAIGSSSSTTWPR